jgi:hypothetical protein
MRRSYAARINQSRQFGDPVPDRRLRQRGIPKHQRRLVRYAGRIATAHAIDAYALVRGFRYQLSLVAACGEL